MKKLLFIFILSISPCYAAKTPSNIMVGDIMEYEIKKGDTLNKIAGRFGLGIDELMWANPKLRDPTLVSLGRKIILPTAYIAPNTEPEGIVINLPELRLYYFYKQDEMDWMFSFPITIGVEGRATPIGRTAIFDKRENPSWIPPASVRLEDPRLPEIVPPGPKNPLGNHILDLDASKNKKWQSIKIHGTNVPWKIGMKISHGCIRLYPNDIKSLFETVELQTPVAFVNQPIKVAEIEDKIYIEFHPELPPKKTPEDLAAEKAAEQAALEAIEQIQPLDIENEESDESLMCEEPKKELQDYPPKAIFDAHQLICGYVKNCNNKLDWKRINEAVIAKKGIPILVSKVVELNQ